MSEDIVPNLYKQILNDFNTSVDSDSSIKTFIKKVNDGKATQEEASLYARSLGEHASDALIKNLTADVLPDGKIYWNIANRTVKPLLKNVYQLINDAAFKIQEVEDKKGKIGIKPIKATFPEERINAIINKLVNASLEEAETDDGNEHN